MPRTEAGKRLQATLPYHDPHPFMVGCIVCESPDAIEAEAVAAERARIRAAVEESDELGRAAVSLVLRIIDGENSDAQ